MISYVDDFKLLMIVTLAVMAAGVRHPHGQALSTRSKAPFSHQDGGAFFYSGAGANSAQSNGAPPPSPGPPVPPHLCLFALCCLYYYAG